MGRLVIAHHKSYHPYKRDNIERVRRDEEEAALKEAKEEGRMMLADSEARIDRLRERAGLKTSKTDELAVLAQSSPVHAPATPSTSKHINFFEDLEQQNAVIAASTRSFRDKGKKKEVTEDEKGVRLAPTTKDLNPWYSSTQHTAEDEVDEEKEEKRRRDVLRKSTHDPLTSITRQLASSSSAPSQPHSSFRRPLPPASTSEARHIRERSERERARALIARKKREALGSATPSTVVGGRDDDGEYDDMFNKEDVKQAHAHRNRDKHRLNSRRWDDH